VDRVAIFRQCRTFHQVLKIKLLPKIWRFKDTESHSGELRYGSDVSKMALDHR
jgi:hypothetical protein